MTAGKTDSRLGRKVTLLSSSVQAACDAEAELWATDTDLAAWMARMSKDEPTRAMLARIAKQCFSEGVYRGALNVIDGKSLSASILEARAARES